MDRNFDHFISFNTSLLPGPFREPEWPVSNKARKAQVSERVRELSRSKGLVEGFQGNRDVAWNTSKAAKQAVATRRIEELSAPSKYIMSIFLKWKIYLQKCYT